MEKSRLEAFSDGVFAIVITLLILDIRFPEVEYSQFAATLVSVLPRILAYVMSFIIIGLYWVIHHNSMHAIKKTDRGFLWLNILLLLCVSFIPFPTSLETVMSPPIRIASSRLSASPRPVPLPLLMPVLVCSKCLNSL